MEKINSSLALRNAINELEHRKQAEEQELRKQLSLAYESARPANLIKSAFKGSDYLNQIDSKTVNVSAVNVAGYISRNVIVGTSRSSLRKLLHAVAMFALTDTVAKNPAIVKNGVAGVFKILKSLTRQQANL